MNDVLNTLADITAKLKSIVEQISDIFTVKTVSATKVGSTWTSGTITAYKKAGIIYYRASNCALSKVTARTTIATFPEGFRPIHETYLHVNATESYLLVQPNGEVQRNTGDAMTVYAGATVVGGVLLNLGICKAFKSLLQNGGGLDGKHRSKPAECGYIREAIRPAEENELSINNYQFCQRNHYEKRWIAMDNHHTTVRQEINCDSRILLIWARWLQCVCDACIQQPRKLRSAECGHNRSDWAHRSTIPLYGLTTSERGWAVC